MPAQEETVKLDYSSRRIVIAPENEPDAEFIRLIFGGHTPHATLQRGAVVLEAQKPRKPYERTPGDLALIARLQERANAR